MKKAPLVALPLLAFLVLAAAVEARTGAGDAASIPAPISERAVVVDEPAEAPPAAAATGCGTARPAGTTVETIVSSGVTRSYRIHIPRGYDGSKPVPVVLNYHGYGSSAQEQERYSRMVAQSDKSGFITIAPDGTNTPRRWYIYGKWERGYVDDFAFTRAMVAQVAGRACIDMSRIYATGISNGGAMSSQAACEMSELVAAIAPVAGSPYSELMCRNEPPVPVIAFHGTNDKLVPFNGGNGGRLGLPVTPVRENSLAWAEHNGCDLTLKSQRVASDVVIESYGGCDNGADVQLYVIEGGGHTWPGSPGSLVLGPSTRSIDATALMWAFFEAHPKP